MIGLPGETMDDVLAIADICQRVLQVGRRHHGGKAQVKANVSTFVPKVATPFMWSGQDTTAEIEAKVAALRKAMHGRVWTCDGATRGARSWRPRWGGAIAGSTPSSGGHGSRGRDSTPGTSTSATTVWLVAFEEEGLDPAWYAQRDIPVDEPLPWDHLSCGVTREFLARDYRRALSGKNAADCHWGPCYNCGVPAATGFRCQTGEQGPRALLVRPETVGVEPGDRVVAATKSGRWRYVGPPGDPRRQGAVAGSAECGEGAAERGAGATDGSARPEAAASSWPYNLMGTKVQSKSAGLSGLASLVEAAGGESTG